MPTSQSDALADSCSNSVEGENEKRGSSLLVMREPYAGLADALAPSIRKEGLKTVSWNELKEVGGTKEALARLRGENLDTLIFSHADLSYLKRPTFERLALLLCGSRNKFLVDAGGRAIRVTWLKWVFVSLPLFALQLFSAPIILLANYLLVGFLERCGPVRPNSVQDSKRVACLRVHSFKTYFGGTLAHARGVLSGFKRLGWSIDVLTTDKLADVEESGVSETLIPFTRAFSDFPEIQEMAHNLKLLIRGWLTLNRNRPGLLYQRQGGVNFVGVALSRIWKVPLVIEYNSSDVKRAAFWGERNYRFPGLLQRVERLNISRCAVLSAVSKTLRDEISDELGSDSSSRLIVNPNGVDTNKFCPDIDGVEVRRQLLIPKDRVVVGFSGTFMPYQGLQVLTEAIQKLAARPEFSRLHFLLVGDGASKKDLEEQLSPSGLREHVSMPGAVPFEVTDRYLAACDVLVSPHVLPDRSGLKFYWSPIKIFEYMAMGRPIIASRLGQIEEILEDGKDALLVESGNADALASAILKLLNEVALGEELARNALKKVAAQYTWERNIERILEAVGKSKESV